MPSLNVVIEARSGPLQRALTTNSTASSYASHIATTTEPATSDGVAFVRQRTQIVNITTLEIIPFAIGADNVTGSILVVGWNSIKSTNTIPKLWVPTICCDVAFQACALVGVAGTDLLATERLTDTLTVTFGVAVTFTGTGDADVASFLCDVSSFEDWSIIPKIGTATSVNCLFRES